ncbi:unnamed protein product [marine sediment metagenome]|uniref:Ice-binding protein C-terminal domain-containing protein n=1 Tax=marine sediment metagenome TaxID=412755 RepID=X0SY71_9ZZZZ
MPLSAYLGIYPEPIMINWEAATGPVEWYEACVRSPHSEMCGPTPEAWEVAVRACNSEDCGDWSEPRGIIMIPEPGMLLLLGSGIAGLAVISRVTRRGRR